MGQARRLWDKGKKTKRNEQLDRALQEKRNSVCLRWHDALASAERDLTETTLAKRWGMGGCGEVGLVQCVVSAQPRDVLSMCHSPTTNIQYHIKKKTSGYTRV